MAEIPLSFLVHSAIVKPWTGTGAYGDVLGAPEILPCWITNKTKKVRGANGDEILSEATVLFRLSAAAKTGPNGVITLHTETPGVPLREAKIIAQIVHTDGGMGAWQHVEVLV